MPAAELTPDAPFARRFVAYLGERFPLPAYTVLIGALVAGAVATAEGAAGGAAPLAVGWRHLGAFATALLLFFHLRVFDEFKDFAADQLAHPERLLSRGVITLRALGWAGVVVLALQLGINVGLGLWALAWWGAAVAFSVLMRFEFFVGDWLRRHLVAYALLHNPIVAWLMLYVDAVHRGTRPFSPLALGFVAVASFTSLGFEVGRKLRAPADERPGQDTYTAALGTRTASALLGATMLAGGAAAAATAHLCGAHVGTVAGLVGATVASLVPVVSFARRPDARGAKRAELASTLVALVLYGLPVVDIVLRRGVTWSG